MTPYGYYRFQHKTFIAIGSNRCMFSDFVKDSYHSIEHEVQQEKIFDKCRLQSMAWH